jgi:hypothetical protein
VPRDLSKGTSHIDAELTDGLRLQNAIPMKTITASRATTDAAKANREQKAVKADDACGRNICLVTQDGLING